MSRLRVAFVSFHTSPGDPPGFADAGGMNVYVDRLARALGALDVAVDVFTRSAARAATDEVAVGVRIVALPSGPPGPLAKEELIPHAPAFAGAVAAYARTARARYDIVHSHYWQSGVAAIALARRWDVPLVHTHHTIGALKNETRPAGATLEPELRLRAERAVISAAALVTASTDQERLWIGGSSARTLTPGVDHRLFRPGNHTTARSWLDLDDRPLFLAAGRIQALKGLELAVRALPLVDDVSTLLIAGGPSGADGADELARLQRLARDLGVERRVRFLGPQPQRRLADLYRAADALVVCSHSESFGLAALEAHACGTPIVGTTVGGLPTFVREGRSGFLIDRRDPELLAAHLREVLAAGEPFRRAATESAAPFSWERTAHTLLAQYLRLQGSAPHTKMRRNASPCPKPAAWPTSANRRVNHCSNCA
jgi:D-inositol-3-phosphate glycosyltransferase